tara:strand:+ start:773 stop:1021 length:249 start_codon:yes stop_codon:yes gene_type:complete
MLTKKHFELIASAIKGTDVSDIVACSASARCCKGVIARELAREFALLNPRFDEDRFLSACGVREEYDGNYVATMIERERRRD